jgi:beta-glucanase (GH16 family)
MSGKDLIFDDEFNETSIDQTRWHVTNRADHSNQGLEYYLPGNVSVSDGQLVLKSERGPYGGQPYTSAEISTSWRFSFTYGKVEIRAREPRSGKGIWPALWMIGDDCNDYFCYWPTGGANEVDIVEQVNEPYTLRMNAHYGIKRGVDIGSHACIYRNSTDYSADFHIYTFTWQPGGILTWSVDGVQRCQRKAPGYFNTPMHIVISTAVGGGWPGNPDASTPFPQYQSIDYVRVYQ